MAFSVSTPADVANLVLVRLGRDERVGNLYDGSEQAKNFLDIYGQTRDAVMTERDWDFNERMVAATVLKTAPAAGYFPPNLWNAATNPPLPWFFEYAYPADCLKVRALRIAPIQTPNFDPKPVLFTVVNDPIPVQGQQTAPGKVILSNLADAYLVYTGRVTDPTAWKPAFIEAFIAALARRIAPGLPPGESGLAAAKSEAQDEGSTLAMAAPERG